jgi:FMN phosphatase YigB (HAD superfamily)
MPLTLPQYATFLDTKDLTWPAPPVPDRPKAKPHLVRLPEIRAVTWSVYGTLLCVAGGELYFEHPDPFIMNIALGKVLQEFKIWHALPRKPGEPEEQLKALYQRRLAEQRMTAGGGEKHPEIAVERLWESIFKLLMDNSDKFEFDAGFYGSLNEFSRKVAYFFHASLQGTCCYPDVVFALRYLRENGIRQGLLADAQCFTPVQLQRGLAAQDPEARLDNWVDPELRTYSYEVRARKPSERLFRHMLGLLSQRNIAPPQVLHIGTRMTLDVIPARRLGMKAGLFAGDRASLEATQEQLKDKATRPHVLLTELSQIADVIG